MVQGDTITTLATADSHISRSADNNIVVISIHVEHVGNDQWVATRFTEVDDSTEQTDDEQGEESDFSQLSTLGRSCLDVI